MPQAAALFPLEDLESEPQNQPNSDDLHDKTDDKSAKNESETLQALVTEGTRESQNGHQNSQIVSTSESLQKSRIDADNKRNFERTGVGTGSKLKW